MNRHKTKRHNINLTERTWEIATQSGNASAYINRAVIALDHQERRQAEAEFARTLGAHMNDTGETDDWATYVEGLTSDKDVA